MSYKAVCDWRDLTDGHLYNTGDQFPHDGRAVDDDRIAQLMGEQNNAHKRLIEAVQAEPDNSPTQEQKTRKKAVKTRKTAQ